MKFAIIGLDYSNSFSRKMEKALKKLGHNVYFFSKSSIRMNHCPTVFESNYHINMKYPIDLRELLPVDNYDMIIISHNQFVFNNPNRGSTKVLYYHREYLDYPSCLNPDILAYNLPCHDKFMRQYYPQLFFTRTKIDLTIAVDPEEYNPNREKDLTGLNYATCYENVMDEKRDWVWNNFYKIFLEREKRFTSNGCRVNGGRYVDTPELKDYIERSEAFLQFMPPGVFASRRLLECAVSKTLPVIYIESEESRDYHNELGFYDDENCLMFMEKPLFHPKMYCDPTLIDDAYGTVLEKHTYDHRAKQILDLL